jgi:hypothetical protein
MPREWNKSALWSEPAIEPPWLYCPPVFANFIRRQEIGIPIKFVFASAKGNVVVGHVTDGGRVEGARVIGYVPAQEAMAFAVIMDSLQDILTRRR